MTRGPRVSASAGSGELLAGLARERAGRGSWSGPRFGLRGRKEKEKGNGLDWRIGPKAGFFFPNSLKQIQIEFKLKEFEFEKNHKHFKQCKAAWMHNKQNIFVLFYKNNQSLFILTKFPVKKSKYWKKFRIMKKLLFYS